MVIIRVDEYPAFEVGGDLAFFYKAISLLYKQSGCRVEGIALDIKVFEEGLGAGLEYDSC